MATPSHLLGCTRVAGKDRVLLGFFFFFLDLTEDFERNDN